MIWLFSTGKTLKEYLKVIHHEYVVLTGKHGSKHRAIFYFTEGKEITNKTTKKESVGEETAPIGKVDPPPPKKQSQLGKIKRASRR